MTAKQIKKLMKEISDLYFEQEIKDSVLDRVIRELPYDINELDYALSLLNSEYFEISSEYVYVESKRKLTVDLEKTDLNKGYITLTKGDKI